jgi:hypothetical protein
MPAGRSLTGKFHPQSAQWGARGKSTCLSSGAKWNLSKLREPPFASVFSYDTTLLVRLLIE